MQASKIIPGKVYAIKRGNDLLRFRVTEVVTVTRRKREKANPHDHSSRIEGIFLDETLVGEENTPGVKTVTPDDIAGEFSQFTELVERKRLEEEERKRVTDAKNAAARDLALAFYELIGQSPPSLRDKKNYGDKGGVDGYDSLFRPSWDTITIKQEGVAALLPVLQAVLKSKEVV